MMLWYLAKLGKTYKMETEYEVFNLTDGLGAYPYSFSSYSEAETALNAFKARFEVQGYYLTKNMEKLDIDALRLEIRELK